MLKKKKILALLSVCLLLAMLTSVTANALTSPCYETAYITGSATTVCKRIDGCGIFWYFDNLHYTGLLHFHCTNGAVISRLYVDKHEFGDCC